MYTRKKFLQLMAIQLGGLFGLKPQVKAKNLARKNTESQGVIYRSSNGTPEMNLTKVINMMGGITSIIGSDDVVVIKPNLQWWNQGAPNLAALKTFVDLIMAHPDGFNGEVVIAENCHRGPNPSSFGGAWNRDYSLNIDIPDIQNMRDLANLLKSNYGDKFSMYHWFDVDENVEGHSRVYGPADGTGYVYCDGTNGVPLIKFDNGATGENYREVIMTYPIFSTDRGTIIDFKNGIWEAGSYTDQPLRYINFAALNHHGGYVGFTSAVKNYLGVTDLSGGPDPNDNGLLTGDYYNFHSFPYNKWASGPVPGMLGAQIGVFLTTIRKADLNITTAEWIGLESRTNPPVVQTKTILASKDTVALDYYAAKYILYPNSGNEYHNPDNVTKPGNQYLVKCAEQGGGVFDEQFVSVEFYDFNSASTITVTSPNGGENLIAGSSYTITWTFENVENVKIEYSVDGGTNWTDIESSISALSSPYTWAIPGTLSSSDCLIKVTDVSNATVTDQSDNTFTIQTGGIWGDVDNNGTVDIADALKIATYDVYLDPSQHPALAPILEYITQRGDVNADGAINVVDALICATYELDPENTDNPRVGKNIESSKIGASFPNAISETYVVPKIHTNYSGNNTYTVMISMTPLNHDVLIGASTLQLSWNSKKYHYISVENREGGNVIINDDNAIDGVIRMAQFDVTGYIDFTFPIIHFKKISDIVSDQFTLEIITVAEAKTFKHLPVENNITDFEMKVGVESDLPQGFNLYQNMPNPFNSFTTIKFTIPQSGFTNLTIYNIAGQKIKELVAENLMPGTYSYIWDGKNDNNTTVSSGIYIYRLKLGHYIANSEMMLVK